MRIRVPVKHYESFNKSEIRYLNGGKLHGEYYFVVQVIDGHITGAYYAKLRNNLQSQRKNSSYPAGYLPFLINGQEYNFDIETSQLEIPEIFSYKTQLFWTTKRINALIIKSPAFESGKRRLLNRVIVRTELEQSVRQKIVHTKNYENLEIITALLQETWEKNPRPSDGVDTKGLLQRFESSLDVCDEQALRNIADLLSMDHLLTPAALTKSA